MQKTQLSLDRFKLRDSEKEKRYKKRQLFILHKNGQLRDRRINKFCVKDLFYAK